MRNSMLKRAAALLIGTAAVVGTAPAAFADAPQQPTVSAPAPIHRTMPHSHAVSRLAKSAQSAQSAAAAAPNVLQPGQTLEPGQSLTDNDTTLVMQPDGNLVLYLVAPNGRQQAALWSSKTWGNNGAYALMQTDGNLVVYRQGKTDTADALWSSWTWGHNGAYTVLVDGDLMLGTDSADQPLWQTSTGFIPTQVNGSYTDTPSDTLASGQGLAANTWVESASTWLFMQPDGNLVLYRKHDGAALWSSGTWNHPGLVTVMATNGVLAVADNNQVLWNNGTWNNPGAYAKVQSDGNFVVYSQGRNDPAGALWSSNTYGTGWQ
ncbi:hypothetical protein [Kitasatospora sp. NBC_01302]|uniref:hypothetical protein n=1 Tax=Kitasatospora sp. NBC_01302 TaxID=2903575 RepID=UPI002E12C99B|nr:hypothetical protein OG294_34255 [Kitasatospora sp. NBC_01302]